MRRITYIIIILCLSLSAYAQKKDIAQAREFVKKGNNLPKAEQLMSNLLKDSVNRRNDKIWLTLFDAQKKQYEQGNEKLYLKQQYDTASLFASAKKMFQTLEGLDSVDALPDDKGKVKLNYRKKHAALLNVYRRNLYNGGIYFVRHKKYKEAYGYFDMYIDCGRQPLFSDYNYNDNDPNMPTAAYWAVYCGYKLKDAKATLHHTYLALKDTTHYHFMLQYLAETYKQENDMKRYLQTLEEGFAKYPRFPFFFPRLIEFYTQQNDLKEALDLCNKALRNDSTSSIYNFSKSSVLLSMKQYDACRAICQTMIARKDSLPGIYLNMGLAYFNQAVEMDKSLKQSASQRKEIMQLYQKAMPYLETYRKKAPDQKQVWGLPLYTIYLNLNKGKEFDEIDKLLR